MWRETMSLKAATHSGCLSAFFHPSAGHVLLVVWRDNVVEKLTDCFANGVWRAPEGLAQSLYRAAVGPRYNLFLNRYYE